MIDRPFGHENTGLDTCKQTAVKDLAIIIYDREDLASTIRTFRGRRSLSTIFNLSPNDDGELNDPMEINRNEITFSFDTRCQHVFQPCATRRCVARRITAKFFIYGRKLARKRGVLKKKKKRKRKNRNNLSLLCQGLSTRQEIDLPARADLSSRCGEIRSSFSFCPTTLVCRLRHLRIFSPSFFSFRFKTVVN